jgi:hypothetical protein
MQVKLLFPIDEKQLSYGSNSSGYTLFYRGVPIGGAGAQHTGRRHWRHVRADVRMYADNAAREVEYLKQGKGQPRFMAAIHQIEGERQLAKIPGPGTTAIDVTAHHDAAGKLYFPSAPYGIQVWLPDMPASNGGHNFSDSAKTKTEAEQKARQQADDFRQRKTNFVLVMFRRATGKVLLRIATGDV